MGRFILTTEDWIRYYVPLVNAEAGRSDRNEQSIEYFKKFIGFARFDFTDQYCLVTMTVDDAWGDKAMSVVVMYIKPEYRTRYIREVLRKVSKFANEDKVSYINIGSQINKKLHGFLLKQGYEVSAVRRYL